MKPKFEDILKTRINTILEETNEGVNPPDEEIDPKSPDEESFDELGFDPHTRENMDPDKAEELAGRKMIDTQIQSEKAAGKEKRAQQKAKRAKRKSKDDSEAQHALDHTLKTDRYIQQDLDEDFEDDGMGSKEKVAPDYSEQALKRAQLEKYKDPELVKKREIELEKIKKNIEMRIKNQIDALNAYDAEEWGKYVEIINKRYDQEFDFDPNADEARMAKQKKDVTDFWKDIYQEDLATKEHHLDAGITNKSDGTEKDYKSLALIRFPMLQDKIGKDPWTVVEIVKAMTGRVQNAASRMASRSRANTYGYGDLVQAGLIGVLNAIRTDAGISVFGPYALKLARNYMKAGLTAFNQEGRGARFFQPKAIKKAQAFSHLASDEEVQSMGEALGWSEEKIKEEQALARAAISSGKEVQTNFVPMHQEISGADGSITSIAAGLDQEQSPSVQAYRVKHIKTGKEGTWERNQGPLPGHLTMMRDNNSAIEHIRKIGVGEGDDGEPQKFESPQDISTALKDYFDKDIPANVVKVLKGLKPNAPSLEIEKALEKAGIEDELRTDEHIKHYRSAIRGKPLEATVKGDITKRTENPYEAAAREEQWEIERTELEKLINTMKSPEMGQDALSSEQELILRLIMNLEDKDFIAENMKRIKPKEFNKQISEYEAATAAVEKYPSSVEGGDAGMIHPVDKVMEKIAAIDSVADPTSGSSDKKDKKADYRWLKSPTRPMTKVQKIYMMLKAWWSDKAKGGGNAATMKWNKIIEKIVINMRGPLTKKFTKRMEIMDDMAKEFEKIINNILDGDNELSANYVAAGGVRPKDGGSLSDATDNPREMGQATQKVREAAYQELAKRRGVDKDEVIRAISTADIFDTMGVALGTNKNDRELDQIYLMGMLKAKKNDLLALVNAKKDIDEIAEIMREKLHLDVAPNKNAIQKVIREITIIPKLVKYLPHIHKSLQKGFSVEEIAQKMGINPSYIEAAKTLGARTTEKEMIKALDVGATQDEKALRYYKGLMGQVHTYEGDGWDDKRIANRLGITERETKAFRILSPRAPLQEIYRILDAATEAEMDKEETGRLGESIERRTGLFDEFVFKVALSGIEAGVCDEVLLNELINGNK